MKQFTLHAHFDTDARVWFGSIDELPMTTEADTLDALVARVVEIAPEIAVLNGLAESGEQFCIQLSADRVATAAA